MSTATARPIDQPPVNFSLSGNPIYLCQVCPDTQIRPEFVFYNYREEGLALNARRGIALCEHCQTPYTWLETCHGGDWKVLGAVGHITDARKIAGLKARVDHVQGVIKQRALSA